MSFCDLQYYRLSIWRELSFCALCSWGLQCYCSDVQHGTTSCCTLSWNDCSCNEECGSGPPAIKSRLCMKFNSAEGCKFGDKCHFAHGEWEIGKPVAPSFNDHHGRGPMHGLGARMMEPSFPPPPSGFGASASTKISVDASLAGPIIGKGGVNSKQICRLTGVKLSIRDHETDPNLRNIELEGSFEQISQASAMVRELIVNVSPMSAPPISRGPPPPSNNYKTKLCENFGKGSCTFGDRCHFAHGAAELRTTL